MLLGLGLLTISLFILILLFGVFPAILIFIGTIVFICCFGNDDKKDTNYNEVKNDYIPSGDLKCCNKTEKIDKGFNKYEN